MKMKTYKYTGEQGDTETITGSDKYQEIRFNVAGVPVVRYGNIRIKLYDVMHYEDKDLSRLLGCDICGAYNDTIYSAYLIHISDTDSFQAKVFYRHC